MGLEPAYLENNSFPTSGVHHSQLNALKHHAIIESVVTLQIISLRKTTMNTGSQRIEIYGLINDISFQKARFCAEDLNKKDPGVFPDPIITGMLEYEWDLFIDAKKKELRGESWAFNEKAICFANSQLIGGPDDFVSWAQEKYNYEEYRPDPLYETLREEAYKSHLNSKKHDYVYMDISIAHEPIGRLVFELFTDLVPKTCENFKALCTGEKGKSIETDHSLNYKNTVLHRIVPNGWVQGGDIVHGRGNSGESIFGAVFEDENFGVKHSRRGILGMANKGRHTNGSQFYITLQPAPWMDTKYVAFGQVIEGTDTLKAIEEQETMNERPNKDIIITDCGVCVYEF